MKNFTVLFSLIMIIMLASGCLGRGTAKNESSDGADTITVPDTGFTGIKQYSDGIRIIKEVTFENGVRQGEMKSFYAGGQLYQSFWYEKGLREDSARWYYVEGQVFRSTPYKHDTIDGIQVQYYRTGRVKAKIKYIKGFRAPFLEEYTQQGRLVTGYPEIIFSLTDNYNSTGKLRVNLELSDKSPKVKFYRGDFTNGVFDSTRCVRLKVTNGKAYIDLRKSGSPQQDYIAVIGEAVTGYGNRYLAYKKIDLPYKDLK
ncbi:MAG: hypothetical protein WAL29_14170 [Bacteroidales bacterium]